MCYREGSPAEIGAIEFCRGSKAQLRIPIPEDEAGDSGTSFMH